MNPHRSWIIGSAVLLAVATSIIACGPGKAPGGQPAMTALTASTLEELREQFNEAVGQTRVVLLLSPT